MTMRNMQPAKQPEKDNDDNTLKICKVVKDYKKWFRFWPKQNPLKGDGIIGKMAEEETGIGGVRQLGAVATVAHGV